jgi:DNA-binding transcriptional LysR family regulator
MDAALNGLGVCQLPDFYVAEAIARGRLVRLLPDHEPADEGVWGVYVSRKHLAPKVSRLIDHLRTGLSGGTRGGSDDGEAPIESAGRNANPNP